MKQVSFTGCCVFEVSFRKCTVQESLSVSLVRAAARTLGPRRGDVSVCGFCEHEAFIHDADFVSLGLMLNLKNKDPTLAVMSTRYVVSIVAPQCVPGSLGCSYWHRCAMCKLSGFELTGRSRSRHGVGLHRRRQSKAEKRWMALILFTASLTISPVATLKASHAV